MTFFTAEELKREGFVPGRPGFHYDFSKETLPRYMCMQVEDVPVLFKRIGDGDNYDLYFPDSIYPEEVLGMELDDLPVGGIVRKLVDALKGKTILNSLL
ncbi:MAG: hypothetical protein ABIB47_03990 [Candidatus Woesearchaeota archaeon]